MFDEPAPSYCENGTVGFAGDSADANDWFSLGTGDNDGFLLVKVTLFRGKSPDVEAKPGIAQGMTVICRVNTMFGHRIPPLGAVVLVMCDGNWETHGNPVIVAVIEKNPLVQLDPKRVVEWYGDDVHKVTKGKSIALQDTPGSDVPSVFFSVGTPKAGGARGISALDETGSGFTVQSGVIGQFISSGSPATGKTMLQLTKDAVDVIIKNGTDSSGLKIVPASVSVTSKTIGLLGGQLMLGATATALTPALTGPTGVAGVASLTTFIGP